ncbi:hypothetical protein [Streptomyces sp. NPDC005438]
MAGGVLLGRSVPVEPKEPTMADLVFVLVTVAAFALVALVARGVRRL